MKLARCLRSAPGALRNTVPLVLSTSCPSRPSTSSQSRRGFATQRRRKTNVKLRKDLKPEYYVEDSESFKFQAPYDAEPIPIESAPIEDFENDPKYAPSEEAPDKVPQAFRSLPPVIEIEGDAENTPEDLSREHLLKWKPTDESPLVGRTFDELKELDSRTRARLGPNVRNFNKPKNSPQYKQRLDELITNNPLRPFHKQPSAKHLMTMVNEYEAAEVIKKRPLPNFKVGQELDVVLKQSLKSEETHTVRGMVISRRGELHNSSFTLRSMADGEAYEQVLPLYSPWIKSITVVGRHPVKKNKLYYMRKWPEHYTTTDLLKKLNYRSEEALAQREANRKRLKELKRERRLQTAKRRAARAEKKAAKRPTIGGPSKHRITAGLELSSQKNTE